MQQNTVSGKFITFEGGEGTGKSTQIAALAARLRGVGRTVLETREPGGTPEAERIRELLVSGATDRWSPEAETLLNYAARDHHLRALIRPALEQGTWVLSDRYTDSTRAYQGIAGGVANDLLAALEQEIIGETTPDLTFVLDLDPQAGLARASERAAPSAAAEDRFENKGLQFHTILRQAFLDIASAHPHRCVVVDAARPRDDVENYIWDTVVSRLAP